MATPVLASTKCPCLLYPGFLIGLLVSVFSKTLVLLAGIGIIATQVSLSKVLIGWRARLINRQGCFQVRHRCGRIFEAEEAGCIITHPIIFEEQARVQAIVWSHAPPLGLHVILNTGYL